MNNILFSFLVGEIYFYFCPQPINIKIFSMYFSSLYIHKHIYPHLINTGTQATTPSSYFRVHRVLDESTKSENIHLFVKSDSKK